MNRQFPYYGSLGTGVSERDRLHRDLAQQRASAAMAKPIATDENRFQALKFAVATAGADIYNVLQLANDYHRFLTGEATALKENPPDLAAIKAGFVECLEDQLAATTAEKQSEPTELDTMVTESLEAAEAVVAEVADEAAELQAMLSDEEAEAEGLPTNTDQLGDWLSAQAAWAAPTFEQVAAAVEEIASPPPPAEEDPSDDPELTTEQVERYEDTLRAADRVAVAPKEPEPEVQPAKAAWVDYAS